MIEGLRNWENRVAVTENLITSLLDLEQEMTAKKPVVKRSRLASKRVWRATTFPPELADR
jgi:hypothetical protein